MGKSINQLFLKEDIKHAEKRIDFMRYCLIRAIEVLRKNEFDLADIWVNEFTKCTREIEVMMKKKEERNKIQDLVNQLIKRGVNAEVVRKIEGEINA